MIAVVWLIVGNVSYFIYDIELFVLPWYMVFVIPNILLIICYLYIICYTMVYGTYL